MASGKKSKERRRAASAVAPPPPVRSKGAPRRRQASPRVLAAAGAVVVLAIVGIVLGVVLGGGKSSSITISTLPTRGSLVDGLPGASEVSTLLTGIPQSGLRLGSPSAPVTLVEYIDLQCPYCQQFETQVMPDVVKRYVRTGKVKVEARVLAFIGPDSTRGRDAMIAAGRQGKAFQFAQVLYDNQRVENTGWLDDEMVARAAESVPGLNPRQLFQARDSSEIADRAKALDKDADAAGVTSTPTLFVGPTAATATHVALRSPTDEQTLLRAIDAALAA